MADARAAESCASQMLTDTLVVARRFRGPEGSANGGYICGLIAALAPWPATVRLMKPPPLDTELRAAERDGLVEVSRGEEVIAQARPGEVGELAVPRPPSRESASEASFRYPGFSRHPAPTCFVCGPERSEEDGLRIFPGAVADTTDSPRVVAAPWKPDASLDDGAGNVATQFLWAALDCPGYVSVAGDMRPMLLGELTANVAIPVRIGERCTVIGWSIGSSGRKHEVGTAVFDGGGRLRASARALWIEPRAPADTQDKRSR